MKIKGEVSLKENKSNRGTQLIQRHSQKVQTCLEKEFSTIHLYYNKYFLPRSGEETNPRESEEYVTYCSYTCT